MLKLALTMIIALPLCILLLNYAAPHSQMVLAVFAVAGTLLIFAVSYFVFGLDVVRTRLFAV